MANYPNTPVMSQIQLPSGNKYYIKDGDARAAIDELEQRIAGGMGFKIVWTQTDWASSTAPTATKLATIPAGVVVHYNSGAGSATGTLAASSDTLGNFYLVYSTTQVGPKDIFNEYATITTDDSTYDWEKIGDTEIDLSGVVTDVSLSKNTANVIGASSTLTTTTPKITLQSFDNNPGTTSGTPIQLVTDVNVSSSAHSYGGLITDLGDPSTEAVLKSVTITSDSTGDVTVATGINNATTKYLSAAASGGAVSASGDDVTAITGVTDTTTKLSATASITGKTGSAASSVTPTTAKLATTTITGVSGSTSITPVESRTSQTTATGSTSSSTTNTDILKGASVSNETLILGACTLGTQTTYSADAPRASLAVPTAASATTVATGSTTSNGSGASVVTGVSVGDTITVVTAAPTITLTSGSTGDVTVSTGTTTTNDSVVGSSSTFNVTNPTITLTANSSSGTGRIQYVQSQGSVTTTKLSATPNETANAVTGYENPTTTTISTTTYDIGGTKKWILGTSNTPTTSWNSKDQKTVLTNATDVSVTKGTNSGE